MANRLSNIDSLRGLAALLVVWQHTSESFIKLPGVAANGTIIAEIISKFDFGRIGIVCFFLISGFVIPFSLKNKHEQAIKKFAIRRFFRLYPVYWLSLLAIISFLYIINQPINKEAVLANTTMLQSFFTQPHMIGLYWTLQVELIFYTLCALLFHWRLLNNEKVILTIISIGFLLFVAGQAYIRLFSSPLNLTKEFQIMPYLLSIMFLGALYRKLYDQSQANKLLKNITILATLICFAPPLLLLIMELFNFHIFAEQFRFGAGHTFALVLFFVGLKYFKFSPKWMIGLGTISYSVYLFHPIIMRVLLHVLANHPNLLVWHVSLYMAIISILTIILSIITYKIIEKPAINKSYQLTRS